MLGDTPLALKLLVRQGCSSWQSKGFAHWNKVLAML